jgi:hypothetical protein
MKPISHHINKVKAQPHHIRKQVAFATAFIVAAVIGAIWAGASLITGAFAIQGSTFAESTGAEPTVATVPGNSSLAASPAEAGQQSQAPGIEIVNGNQTPAAAPAATPTVIPF